MTINTIPASTRRAGPYTASGGQTVFSYGFPIYDDDDLRVTRLRGSTSTVLTVVADYTVTGAGEQSGGTIVLVAGATAGDIITIDSAQVVVRDSFYSGDLPVNVLNRDFNRLWIALQQALGAANAGVWNIPADLAPGTLPVAALRASTIMGFNAAGQPVLITIPTGTVTGTPPVWGGIAGGTANALTITTAPALTALVVGQEYKFIANVPNTGAATMAVDAIPPVPLRKGTGVTALADGDLQANTIYSATFDGAVLRMDTALGTGGGGGGGDSPLIWGGQATGTANAMTITPATPIAAYAAGLRLAVITPSAGTGNSGAVTAAVSGLSAQAVRKGDGTVAMDGGDLPPSTLLELLHDGTRFRVMAIAELRRSATLNFATINCGASTGTSTDYTLVLPVASVNFARPFEVAFTAHVACGVAPNVTIGATTKALKRVSRTGTMAALAIGDVFASQPVRAVFDPGLDHFVMTSPLASYMTAADGGDATWKKINNSAGTSAVAAVTFELSGAYTRYRFDLRNMTPVGIGENLLWILSFDGGLTYPTSGYVNGAKIEFNGTTLAGTAAGPRQFQFENQGGPLLATLELDKTNKQAIWQAVSSGLLTHGSSACGTSGTPTHIRFLYLASNVATHDIQMSGL